MSLSRRKLLQWSLGAAQVALLARAGLFGGRAHAQASSDAPSRLCVLYVPGGFRFQHRFWPGSDDEVVKSVPAPGSFSGEPIFFRADQRTPWALRTGPTRRCGCGARGTPPRRRRATPRTPRRCTATSTSA